MVRMHKSFSDSLVSSETVPVLLEKHRFQSHTEVAEDQLFILLNAAERKCPKGCNQLSLWHAVGDIFQTLYAKPKHHTHVFSFEAGNFWKCFCSKHWAEVSRGQELPVGDRLREDQQSCPFHPSCSARAASSSSCPGEGRLQKELSPWGSAQARVGLDTYQDPLHQGRESTVKLPPLQASQKQPDRIFSWTTQHLNGPLNQKHLPTAMTSCCLLTLATSLTPFSAPLLEQEALRRKWLLQHDAITF